MVTLVTPSSSLKIAQDRVQDDLIADEQQQRQVAERLARDLAKVLQEVATAFDGSRLEDLRRSDPNVPKYWTPADWRKFFEEVPPQTRNGWSVGSDNNRVAELERRCAELQNRMQQTELILKPAVVAEPPAAVNSATVVAKVYTQEDAARENEKKGQPATKSMPTPEPVAIVLAEGAVPPIGNLLVQVRQVWSGLPNTCPASFQKMLPGGGRTGETLKKAYQRYWLTLYLIGACQLNAKFEIEDLLALAMGMSSRAGSLGRIIEDLQEANILIGQTLQINSPKSSLRLLKLSPEGVRLFSILFEKEPLETDWECLVRLHEGDRFPEHTVAVLIFALHARKRGWATQILPPVKGTKAVPDLLVMRGTEKLYVEVELGQKESPTKWRNQAALNDGKVALCAATPDTRARLGGDCRLAKLRGVATDLESLVKVKHSTITDQDPLWLESW